MAMIRRNKKDLMSLTQEELDAAFALRAKHERIGALVCENKEELVPLTTVSIRTVAEGSAKNILEAILAEVEP